MLINKLHGAVIILNALETRVITKTRSLRRV